MVARPAAVNEVAGRPDMGGVIKKAAERRRDAMNEAAGWLWGCRRRQGRIPARGLRHGQGGKPAVEQHPG